MAYVTPEYLDIQDGDFAPADTWYVGENSVDSGGNYYVFFQKLPTYNAIESLSITETLTAVVFTGQQRVSEGIFIDVLGQNGLTSNTNYANGIGVVFTAPRTTSLGTFRWKGVYAGSNAVSDGIIYVRLYAATYSSGVLGSLIAEKQIPVTTGTSYANILNDIDLFNQGFNVTSGQSYGVTITWSVAQLFGGNLSSSYYQGTYPSYYKPASGYSGLPWLLMSFSDEGALEIPTSVLDAVANQSETGTSNDSLEGVYSNTSYKTESPTTQFANSYLTGDLSPSAGSGSISSSSISGIRFTANQTGNLGRVTVRIENGTNFSSSTPGTISLRNHSTGTTLASIPFLPQQIPVAATNYTFDFSSVPGASLTQGTTYNIVLAGGADWSVSDFIGIRYYSTGAIYDKIIALGYQFFSGNFVTSAVNLKAFLFKVEQAVNYDVVDSTSLLNSSASETVTTAESADRKITNYGNAVDYRLQPFSDLITPLTQSFGSQGSGYNSPDRGFGSKFIAEATGTVANIKFFGSRIDFSGTNPNGTSPALSDVVVSLWTLTSNVNTAGLNTQLASISVPASQITTSDGIQSFDFSSFGITLTEGNAYGVTFTIGADWATNLNGLTWKSAYFETGGSDEAAYNQFSSKQTVIRYYSGTTWINITNRLASIAVTQATDTSDIVSGNFSAPVDLTETGIVTDTTDRSWLTKRWVSEPVSGDGAVEALLKLNSGGINLHSGVTPYIAQHFVAPKSGRIGQVTSTLSANAIYGSTVTTAGTIELWTLTGNSVSGIISTKLAQIPLYWSLISPAGAFTLGDFTAISGADIVSGNAYALVFRPGSDWSATNGHLVFAINQKTNFGDSFNNYYYASGVTVYTASFLDMQLDYATTTTDTFATALSADAASTETGSTTESSITLKTANSWNYESSSGDEVFSSFVPSLASVTAYSLYAASTGTGVQAAGASFIAGITAPIGKVTFSARKNGVVGNQPGTAELWQLSSNSLTATPSVLLASVPFNITLVPTAPGGAGFSVDFTGVSGASVTAGVGYAIVCRAGSDWTNTSAYVTIYGTNSNNATEYNTFYPSSRVVSVNTSGNWVTPATNVAGNIAVEPANTTIEYATQSSLLFTDLAETATSTDLVNRALTQRAREDEAPGGLLVAAIPTFSLGSGSTGEKYVGVKFIANQSTQLGDIYGGFYRDGAGSPTSTLGALELWQLSSNSITAPVQTKIAEVPFDLRDVSTASSTNLNYMGSFKSNPSATVVEGNAYAVIFVQGADWSITTSQRLYDNFIVQSDILNTLPYTYILGSGSRDTVLSSTQYGKGWKIQPAFNNAQEQSVNIITTSVEAAETGSSADSQSRVKSSVGYIANEDALIAVNKTASGAGGPSGAVYSGNSPAQTFIAPTTGKVGTLWVRAAISAALPLPSTVGAVELWQLASNDINATPQTKLASIPLDLSLLSTSANEFAFDFSNVAGASVTAGVGYALVFKGGTDWAYNTTKTLNIVMLLAGVYGGAYDTAANSLSPFYRMKTGAYGSWPSTGYLLHVGLFYSSALETPIGNYSTDQVLSETLNSSEENSALSELLGLIDESQTATDSIDNLTSFIASLTETGTVTDTETATNLAFGLGFETGSGVPTLVTAGWPADYNIFSSIANSGGGSLKRSSGQTFIANRTGQLGKVAIALSRNTTGTVVTGLGSIELWSLSTNTIAATPQTLLASIPFSLYSLSTSAGNYAVDFSTITGANLTSGDAYAIIVTTGSDWVSGTTNIAYVYKSGWFAGGTTSTFSFTRLVERNYSGTWSSETSRFIGMSIEYANTTADVLTGGFTASTSISENVNTSEENSALLELLGLIDESQTATDSIDNLTSFVGNLTETGTSSDIQSNLIVANAWNAQSVAGDALVNANSGFSPNSITNYSVANTGTGTKFIASKSTNLGMAIFKMSRVNTGFPLPTQPGTVELWQLSSNSLTSIPQTLLASVSFNLGSLPTNSTDVAFDFTDVSGASITAGVGYAIVVRTGSDWSTSTQYFSVSAVTTVAQLNYLSSKYASMTYTSAGVWSNTTSLIRVLDLYPANTTVDVLIGGFDAFASLSETINSSEENSSLLEVLALIDETGTSTDSIDNITSFVASLTETGTITETSNRNITALGLLSENTFFNSYIQGASDYSGYVSPGNASTFGLKFIANTTGRLGRFISPVGIGQTQFATAPTTPGRFELWQLSNNTLTGTLQTLVATKNIYLTRPSTLQSQLTFADIPEASVTAGVGYAIMFTCGADWVYGTTDVLDVAIYTVNNSKSYNYLKNAYLPTPSSPGIPIFAIAVLDIAVDSLTGNYTTNALLSETGNASETEYQVVTALRDITESGTGTDSQFNITTLSSELTETTIASDDETVQTDFVSVITETATTTESLIGNYLTDQFAEENGTASDNQVNIVSFISFATETVTTLSEESVLATFVSDIFETGTVSDEHTNTAILQGLGDEVLSALESSNNTTVFVTELTESILSEESQSNIVSFISSLLETIDPTTTELSNVDFVSFADELASANDESFNIASRIADLTEQLFLLETSETQIAFVSAIDELLNGVDTPSAVFTTFSDIVEYIASDDNNQAFADFVSSIIENLENIDSASSVAITVSVIEELVESGDLQSGISSRIADLVEVLAATDSSTKQAIFRTIIEELGIAEDQLAAWMLVAIDWDTLAYQFANVEFEYDDIYIEGIEVLYGNNMECYAELSYDGIYVDDLEVGYGNLPSVGVADDGSVDFRYVA